MKKRPRFSVCMVLKIERKMKLRKVTARKNTKNYQEAAHKKGLSMCTFVVETIYVHSEASMRMPALPAPALPEVLR